MNILLISEDYLKTNSNLNDNAFGKWILPAIRESQEMGLMPIIGECLYNKLCELVENGRIKNESYAAYKALLDDKVRPYLLYQTLTNIIPIINGKMGNIGTVATNDEHIVTLTQGELDLTQNYYRERADFYARRLQKFVKENADAFPELECPCGDFEPQLERTNNSVGLWLGGLRGRKVADADCGCAKTSSPSGPCDCTEEYEEGYAEGVSEQKSKLSSVTITENTTVTREDGWSAVTVDVQGGGGNIEDEVNVYLEDDGTEFYTVTPDAGYDGMARVEIDASTLINDLSQRQYNNGKMDGYQEGYDEGMSGGYNMAAQEAWDESQVLNVTENGTYDASIEGVAGYYREVNVSVQGGGGSCSLQNRSVEMSGQVQTFLPTSETDAFIGMEEAAVNEDDCMWANGVEANDTTTIRIKYRGRGVGGVRIVGSSQGFGGAEGNLSFGMSDGHLVLWCGDEGDNWESSTSVVEDGVDYDLTLGNGYLYDNINESYIIQGSPCYFDPDKNHTIFIDCGSIWVREVIITDNGSEVLNVHAGEENGEAVLTDDNGTVLTIHYAAPDTPIFESNTTNYDGMSAITVSASGVCEEAERIGYEKGYTDGYADGYYDASSGSTGTTEAKVMNLYIRLNNGDYLWNPNADSTNLTVYIGDTSTIWSGGPVYTGATRFVSCVWYYFSDGIVPDNFFSGNTTLNSVIVVDATNVGQHAFYDTSVRSLTTKRTFLDSSSVSSNSLLENIRVGVGTDGGWSCIENNSALSYIEADTTLPSSADAFQGSAYDGVLKYSDSNILQTDWWQYLDGIGWTAHQ